MCNRAMQDITSENWNVIDLAINLLQNFVDRPSGKFDKLSIGNWQHLQIQGQNIPTRSAVNI